MRKLLNWPALYAYLVCIVMLIAFIYAAGLLMNSVLDLVVPPSSSNSEYGMYEYPMQEGEQADYTITPEAQELYDNTALKLERDRNIRDIVAGTLMLAIIIPLYIYHWLLGKKYRYYKGSGVSFHDLYYYLASLITLVVGVVAVLGVIRALTEYFWGASWGLPPIQSLFPYDPVAGANAPYVITEVQVQAMIETQTRNYFPRDQLISQTTTFLVAASLYLFHWLNAKNIPAQTSDHES